LKHDSESCDGEWGRNAKKYEAGGNVEEPVACSSAQVKVFASEYMHAPRHHVEALQRLAIKESNQKDL
jgi:hypothetical protein